MSPCFHLYTNQPLEKRLQRLTKTLPSYLKYCEDYNHKLSKNRVEPLRRRDWARVSMNTALSLSKFIFLREKMKSAGENNLLPFFFFSGGKYFTQPFLPKFSGVFWSFLGQIYGFFLGNTFLNFVVFFEIRRVFFLREKIYFLGLNNAGFFLGYNFISPAVFKIFLIGQFENFSSKTLKIFTG